MTLNSAAARDIAHLVHQQTDLNAYSRTGGIIMTSGEGVYVTDDTGKRYLDAMAGMWSAALGFSERRLADAAHRQMLRLPYYHTFNGRTHEPAIDLAEKLVSIAPRAEGMAPMTKVLFQSSGSEANEAAIKLVWLYHNAIGKPQKKKIIGRWRGYHGNTVAAVSLSGQPAMHQGFDLPIPGFLHTDHPHYYREHREGETELQFSRRMAENLEQLILREGPQNIAAFFAEPVQGGGGAVTPPEGYFAAIQPILKKYDILFVADEVICGFGRTGNLWGCQTYDMRPDMIICAKALSASFQPISALMISERIFEGILTESGKVGSFAHGFTFGGHPVTCAVALEALNIYEERDIVGHVRNVSDHFLTALATLKQHAIVGDVRGIGLIAGVEFMADGKARKPFAPELKVAQRVQDECIRRGVIVRAIGDRIAISPPLIISKKEIDEAASALDEAVEHVTRLL